MAAIVLLDSVGNGLACASLGGMRDVVPLRMEVRMEALQVG